MNTAPGLVIALGRTGLRAGEMVHQWRGGAKTADFGLVGIGFDAPPDGFPEPNYVQLTINPEVRLEELGQDLPASISAWFDIDEIRAHWREYQLLPRPLERLAWFDALSIGDRSPLMRLWKNQLPFTRQTLLVFIVVDLGEPAGSSLVLDAAALTRSIAARYNRNIAILLYTVLPGIDANEEEGLRAYVAVQELIHVTTSIEPTYTQAFQYADSDRKVLNCKPLDAWYCFERNGSAAETLAEIVNVYLDGRANEIKRQRMVNISGRMAHLNKTMPLVGTANVRSFVLPVKKLQEYWSLDLALDASQKLVGRTLDESYVTQLCQAFWTGFPTGSLESMLFRQRLRIAHDAETRPLDERVTELDRLLFPSASMVPAAFTPRGLLLRHERLAIGNDKAPQITEALNHAESVLDLFGVTGSESAYQKLVIESVEHHQQLFRDMLQHRLHRILNQDGLTTAQEFLRQIHQDICDAKAIFLQLPASNTMFDDFIFSRKLKTSLDKALHGASKTNKRVLRKQLADYKRYVTDYLDKTRLDSLIEHSQHLLDVMAACVEQIASQITAWQHVVGNTRHGNEQALEEAKILTTTPTRVSVIDDPDQPWAQRQRDRYLAKYGGRAKFTNCLTWAVKHTDGGFEVNLLLDNAAMKPDLLYEGVYACAQEVFQDAENELSLLGYLNATTSKQWAGALINKLIVAEHMNSVVSGETLSAFSGTLFTPVGENLRERRMLKQIEMDLKGAHNIALTDNQLIQRETHSDRQRITYLFVKEFLNLVTEMKVYTDLDASFRDKVHQLAVQSILGVAISDHS